MCSVYCVTVCWGAVIWKIRYRDGMWMELAQGRVQWRALVLAVLNLLVLLAEG